MRAAYALVTRSGYRTRFQVWLDRHGAASLHPEPPMASAGCDQHIPLGGGSEGHLPLMPRAGRRRAGRPLGSHGFHPGQCAAYVVHTGRSPTRTAGGLALNAPAKVTAGACAASGLGLARSFRDSLLTTPTARHRRRRYPGRLAAPTLPGLGIAGTCGWIAPTGLPIAALQPPDGRWTGAIRPSPSPAAATSCRNKGKLRLTAQCTSTTATRGSRRPAAGTSQAWSSLRLGRRGHGSADPASSPQRTSRLTAWSR